MDVIKTTLTKSERKTMRVRVGCPCGGSAKDIEGVMTLGGRSDTRRHWRWQVYRGLKTDVGRFTGLGLKTGGALGVARWQLWRARGVIAKLALR